MSVSMDKNLSAEANNVSNRPVQVVPYHSLSSSLVSTAEEQEMVTVSPQASQPLKDPLKAKPIDHLVIENENVPFARRPDGREAP